MITVHPKFEKKPCESFWAEDGKLVFFPQCIKAINRAGCSCFGPLNNSFPDRPASIRLTIPGEGKGILHWYYRNNSAGPSVFLCLKQKRIH
jgi:hypothetical protein